MLTWEVLQTPEAKAAAHDGGYGGNLSEGEKARVPRMTRDPAHPGERPPGSQQGVHLSQPLRGKKKKKIYIYIYIYLQCFYSFWSACELWAGWVLEAWKELTCFHKLWKIKRPKWKSPYNPWTWVRAERRKAVPPALWIVRESDFSEREYFNPVGPSGF